MAEEVSPDQFKHRLSQEQRSEVDANLSAGMGMAMYADRSGAPRLIRS
jgi:hypothetical protein